MSTATFHVRTDDKKIKRLDQLAEQQATPRNDLVNQALDHFLELHAWREQRIKEGIQAADENRFADDTEMARLFDKYENA